MIRPILKALGAEPHTPVEQALAAALAGMDALPRAAAKLAA